MRVLHTADWHVGKTLRGMSRLEEHRAVLDELAGIARQERVDLVVVAGDVFESSSPAAEAKAVAYQGLLQLRESGAQVVVVAGNHDHPAEFDAVRPLFAQLGIVVVGGVRRPGDGGVISVASRDGNERAKVSLLPFVSQRNAVRADQLLELDAHELAGHYADRVERVVRALVMPFEPDAINVLVAHLTVTGASLGGGERHAQTIFDYHVPATVFPAELHYVALGHLHRQQELPSPCPAWYAGSPLQVDFGEERDTKQALLVEVRSGRPARVASVPLGAGRRLRTLQVTLDELRSIAGSGAVGADDFVRVRLREPYRAGLADEVRAVLPQAVEVIIDRTPIGGAAAEVADGGRAVAEGLHTTVTKPHELFERFCHERGIADQRLHALFARLLDEEVSS